MNIARRPARLAVPLAFALLLATAALGQQPNGSVRGELSDSSGAVLPGVNVVATVNNHIFGSTVTDEKGAFVLEELPPGPTRITFELEGFATSVIALIVRAGVESHVSRRMALASIAETVVVYGQAPDPALVPAPAPGRPRFVPVPPHDRESVCGPTRPQANEEPLGTIQSYPNGGRGALYVEGDELLIKGGTTNGLEVGRNAVVRRHYRVTGVAGVTTGEHTSGLLQIVAAGEHASRAVVVYACDEIMRGDYLASFVPEPVREPDPIGTPAYWDAARVLFADVAQMTGTARRLMVIDRGQTSGLRAGQRLTMFRRNDRDDTAPPDIVGDAVIVAIRGESATIRVLSATRAIATGDWAAPQLYSSDTSPITASASQQDIPR